MVTDRRTWLLRTLLPAAVAGALSGCAALPGFEPPRVTLVGLERLTGEGFEIRFSVKLRIQNPNPQELIYDGMVLDLDVNGRSLASGVSDMKGIIPRYGDVVVSVPVSVHAMGVIRQFLGVATGPTTVTELPYAARGRLGSNWPMGHRFSAEGVLKLPF